MKGGYKYNKNWRLKHPEKRNDQKAVYFSKTTYTGSFNRRNPIRQEEDNLILEHSIPDTELHKIIGRSVRAIQARRHRLKYDLAKGSMVVNNLVNGN